MPSSILCGHSGGCKECAVNSKSDTEEYKENAAKLGFTALGEYLGDKIKILHKCPRCDGDWWITPHNILAGAAEMCIHCSSALGESVMATVVKQVLKHELNAILEYDAGYRGVNGGKSCYDIGIIESNHLVECQSEYHDSYGSVINDRLKKQYAIEHGYKFTAIDSRDKTTLEAIQIFCPHIKEIPDYVDLSAGNKELFPYEKAKELMQNGMNYKELATVLNLGYNIIVRHMSKRKMHMVVQLNKVSLQLIRNYDLSKILKKESQENYAKKLEIIKACKSESHDYLGYLWYFESDYNTTLLK